MKKPKASNFTWRTTRFWMLCLAFCLVLAQAALLQHVAVHELEHAIAQDSDHCTFCAIGNHGTPAVIPQLIPTFTYAAISYAIPDAISAGFSLFTIHLRGPPSPSIV